jgi:potassium efflux system protein
MLPTARHPGVPPWWLACCALALGSRSLPAQTSPPSPSDSSPPQAIAPAAIPDRVEADLTWLATVRAGIPADSTLDSIHAELAALGAPADSQLATIEPARLATLSFDELGDRDRWWSRLAAQLEAWRVRVGEMAGRLDAAHDSLQALQATWDLTLSTSRAQILAPLRGRIAFLRRVADSAGREMLPARDRLVALQSEVSQLTSVASQRLQAVHGAQLQARRRLTIPDAPPLWLVLGSGGEAGTSQVAAQLKVERLQTYFGENSARLRWHVALLVVLAAILTAAGRQRRRWVTSEFAVQRPTQLLAHPVATAWLIAMALSRQLYPVLPQTGLTLAWLLALPALLVLLRELLGPELREPAYALIGLEFLRSLIDVFVDHPLAGRLVSLGITAASAAAFWWFLRRFARAPRPRARWMPLIAAGARIGLVLLGASAVANVAGYVGLAEVVLGATLRAGLSAVGLVAVVEIVVGTVVIVMSLPPIRRLRVLELNRDRLLLQVTWATRAVGVLLWAVVALAQFRLSGVVAGLVRAALAWRVAVGSWTFSPRDVLVFVASLAVALMVARALRALLREDILAAKGLPRGIPATASSLVFYALVAIGVVFAVGAAGIELNRLALVAGALGVGIGFGLQNVVGNFISGLILLFERPIQEGDTVELENLLGVVQSIGIRASRVRTFQGADVIVPNSDLIADRVVNWTLHDQIRRIDIPVGVAYGSDPTAVVALLSGVARDHAKVLGDPEPVTLFMAFGESSLDFEMRLWTRFDVWLKVRSDILVAVYAALQEAGIEIPFPQRDLHLRSVAPEVRDLARGPTS